jgi:HEAT repeat protein
MLGVRSGEEAAVIWTCALFAVSQASQGLGLNAADALFFLRFGVEFLPTMVFVSGPVVMIGLLVFAAGLGRVGSSRWLPTALLASGGLLAVERLGIWIDVPGIYPVVWLGGQVVMMVSLTVMWTAAAEVCTTRQAKRLYPLFASAGIAGGVVGNAATGPLAHALGTDNLLLVQAGLLASAALLAILISRRFFRGLPSVGRAPVISEVKAGLTATFSNPLLRLAAGVAVAFGVLAFLVVFPFSEIVTASFGTEAEVAGYLGWFAAVATALTLVVSLLATNRLFARLGVVVTLMVVPIVYAGGFALWLVSFNLATATLVRGLQFVSLNAVGVTSFNSLFNVLPARRRGQVLAFMSAGPMQIGTMVSGAVLLAGSVLPPAARTVLALTVATTAVVLVASMRAPYGRALVDAVRAGLADVFSAPTVGMQKVPLDADAARAMTLCLDDPRPQARAMAMTTLARVDGDEATRILPKALGDSEARVRAIALEMLADRDSTWSEHAPALLSDPTAQIRRRTLELVWEERLSLQVTDLLEDPAPGVRAMAAVVEGGERARDVVAALLQSEEPGDIRAGLDAVTHRPDLTEENLTHLLYHPDRRIRMAAAPVVAAGAGAASQVRSLLDDPSLAVRRAAATALASSDEGASELLDVLETGTVRASDAALTALTRAGRGGKGLSVWATQEVARAAYLRRHRRALESRPDGSVSAGYLRRVLGAREERLQRWAVLALVTPDTGEAITTVIRGIWSADDETRAQAMEALDSIGDRTVVRLLLEVIEDDGLEGIPDLRSSLTELTSDTDDWIRALAFRCLREEMVSDLERLTAASRDDPSPLVRTALSEWRLPDMQETQTLDVMERVLALQGVRMFADIDPEDLERIALSTSERFFEPGEVIFRQGEEAHEMLVLIRGEVVIRQQVEGESRTIRTYGAGEHVGELALLRRRPRASDVIAGPDGVDALVLQGTDLLAILEERPEVAMAMLGTLAERLATM